MIPCSADFIKAMKYPKKQLYIRLEMFDSQMNFLKEISQQVASSDIGQVSVSRDRSIRRSFQFSLLNNDNAYDFGETNLIWLDKRVKLYIGLKLPNGTVEYIPQGVFILSEPSQTHTLDGKKVTITGQDKAYLLTDRRGSFINQTTIATGTPITTAIKTIAGTAGETLYNFDSVTDITPYELTYQQGDSRWKAIQELSELAKCMIYYDVNGYLTLKQIDLNSFQQYAATWNYDFTDPNERYYAGSTRKLDDGTICNHVLVLGGSGSTAEQRYEIIVTDSDPKWTGSPYTIEKIGRILFAWNNGNPDSILGGSTNDLCRYRAKYELMNRLGFGENVSLNIMPNYLHEAGDYIYIKDPENAIDAKFIINSFSLPINPQIMSIECSRFRAIISDWNSL